MKFKPWMNPEHLLYGLAINYLTFLSVDDFLSFKMAYNYYLKLWFYWITLLLESPPCRVKVTNETVSL